MSLLGRLVGVRWRDAHADAGAQMGPEEIAVKQSYIFTSYGILVRDDRGRDDIPDPMVAVAHERGEDGIFRGVTFIPKQMVIEVEDLGSGRPPKRRAPKPPSPKTLPPTSTE